MPTCCAPNCNKTEKSHPNLSFFNLPWGKPERITLWLSQLRLVHQPGKCARICSDHFEERFLEQDLKFSIAPHLYTKQKKTLTVDAYPTIFEHKKQSAVREISINRQKKRRRKLLIDESLNQREKSEGACAFSTCPSDKETTDESPFTSQYSGENTSAPNVKCQCRCMCRQCTRPTTRSVATQTDRVVTFVKASQCRVPSYHKSVQVKLTTVRSISCTPSLVSISRRKCDHRLKMCARTSGEYREEVRGPKKEEEAQRQLLDDVFNLQPRIVLHRAVDVSEYLHPERQESVSGPIKEEEEGEEVYRIKEEKEEVIHIKEEKQEGSIQVPPTGVHLKSEDESQSEEKRGGEPSQSALLAKCVKTHKELSSGSPCYPGMTFRTTRNCSSHGEWHNGRLQTDVHDDEQSEGDMTCHTTANKCWKCSQCGKTFASMRNLEHVKIHKGEKPFACSVCGQRSTLKEQLKIHKRTNTGEKPFSCSVCGQRFTRKQHLKMHTRTHTGEKPFSCLGCGQRFMWKRDFERHTRTHTGEKPFSCPVCDKRFTEKGYVKRHIRTHAGEKPFPCALCDQRFTQKAHLKTHTRTHTGEKPFSCPVCDKRFTEKGDLKRHTRTHTGEKPFPCAVCGRRFTQKAHLKIHTRTHTG